MGGLQAVKVGVPTTARCRGFITELIERCAKGDEDALGRLVDLLQPLVLSAAGQRFPTRAADDVAVDAFVRVWRRAATYDRRTTGPVGWILSQLSEPEEPALAALTGDHA